MAFVDLHMLQLLHCICGCICEGSLSQRMTVVLSAAVQLNTASSMIQMHYMHCCGLRHTSLRYMSSAKKPEYYYFLSEPACLLKILL